MSPVKRARTATAAALCLALAACGGGARRAAEPSGTPVVAALGDSITAGSPLWDPDPGVRGRLGGGENPESEYEYWAQLALRGRFVFRNCGVFGERTDQIAARLPTCARGARALVVQGGINDIAQGRGPAAAAANLDAMVRDGRRRGLRTVLVEVLPWNNGHPRADAPIRALNRAIHAIGRRRGVPVLPWYPALEDPSRPGRMRAELTIDGDHPSVAGYRKLGRLVRIP